MLAQRLSLSRPRARRYSSMTDTEHANRCPSSWHHAWCTKVADCNTGSHRSNSSDFNMCPPVLLGACKVSQAVACLLVPAHLSKLPSQPSKLFAKCLEILTATSRMCTQWMQERQARSLEIDKTLADIRADFVALQSVPVSSVETKSAISDRPLPESALSRLYVVPEAVPDPQPRIRWGRPSRKNNTRPPFYLPSRRLRPSINRKMNLNEMLSLSGSILVRTRTPSGTFSTNPSQTQTLTRISCAERQW